MVTLIATISKKVSGGDELIVVKKSDFEAFQKWTQELNDAIVKERRGREEYKNGRTVTVSSPRKFRWFYADY